MVRMMSIHFSVANRVLYKLEICLIKCPIEFFEIRCNENTCPLEKRLISTCETIFLVIVVDVCCYCCGFIIELFNWVFVKFVLLKLGYGVMISDIYIGGDSWRGAMYNRVVEALILIALDSTTFQAI